LDLYFLNLNKKKMIIREAIITDITQMHIIRLSVKQNAVNNPNALSIYDYYKMITENGKGWVCESNGQTVGFVIIDLNKYTLWAFFVQPDMEKKGIGTLLMNKLEQWASQNNVPDIEVSTEKNTRAESFFIKAGWKPVESNVHGINKYKIQLKN
jgi:GNAT superfamily N-acetyltransferase